MCKVNKTFHFSTTFFDLFYNLNKKADGTKAVVAGQHRRFFVFHPTVKEISTAVCQFENKRIDALPRTVAKPIGLFCVFAEKDLPLAQIASVLYRIFVFFYKVGVACLKLVTNNPPIILIICKLSYVFKNDIVTLRIVI